jgi:uncharacterized protein (DUF2141 family)
MKLATISIALALASLAACGGNGESVSRRPENAGTGTIVVTVTGFEDDRGQALVNLFLEPEGFPGDPKKAARAVERPIVGRRVEIVFEGVPAGPFALSAFHDANSNFELDTNFVGIPSERWGVSHDAEGFLGPPSYSAAALELKAGERLEVTLPLG